MTLIKLAFNPLSLIPLGGTAFSIRAAKSGNPLNYMIRKTNGPITKQIQRFGLAGVAHAEANLRKGMVQDSTSWRGSILDAQLGQFGRMGIKLLEDVHTNPTGTNRVVKKILEKAITDEGKYNIKNIEKMLNYANKGYKTVETVNKIPLSQLGTISGATIGYSRADDEHKIKGLVKGGLVGGSLGAGVKKGLDFTQKTFASIPKIHQDYFKDNYWKSQLEAANKPFYNKVGKHVLANSLTAYPSDRARRLAQSDKMLSRGEKFWKLMNTDVKDLWNQPQS